MMNGDRVTDQSSAVSTERRSARTPVRFVQSVLHGAHENLGLPWWATIAACTIGFRTLLVPLVVLQLRTARRMFTGAAPAQFAHLTTLASRELRLPKANFYSKRNTLRLYLRGIRYAMIRNKISLWRIIAVPAIQIPMFLTYVFATRDLISHDLARQWGMDHGGLAWFTDLTVVDATYILPVTALGLTYLSIEQGWAFSPTIRNLLQSMVVVSSPFVLSQLPAGVFMYWVPSSLFGLAQTMVIRRRQGTLPPPSTSIRGPTSTSIRGPTKAPLLPSSTTFGVKATPKDSVNE